jgi:serine/threonine protein kinase
VGKQAYTPPEQFRGNPSPLSDIYALGCTMYYMLTARDPEPMQQSNPRSVMPEISPEMNAIVARATEFDTEHRYYSADEVREDLERLPV